MNKTKIMTPKEKAIYLYTMFHQRTSYVEVWYTQELLNKFHDNAKSCALIAVDEMINVVKDLDNWAYIYWVDVKQEIEKL